MGHITQFGGKATQSGGPNQICFYSHFMDFIKIHNFCDHHDKIIALLRHIFLRYELTRALPIKYSVRTEANSNHTHNLCRE